MTTLSGVLDQAERHLHGPYHRDFSLLDVAVTDTGDVLTLSETSTTLQGAPIIRRGVVLNIGTETMLVRSFDTSSQEATVVRGYLGTTAVAHDAGVMVDVNPRFPRGVLWQDLLVAIAGLPESIYRVVESEETVSTSDTERVIALPATMAGCYGVLSVRRTNHLEGEVARFGELPHLFKHTPSGDVVIVDKFLTNGTTVEIRAKLPFDLSAAALTTELVDLGMLDSLADVLAMGVAITRLGWSEAGRSNRQMQNEPRIAEESPALHAIQAIRGLRDLYKERLSQEAAKLWAMNGVRWS